MSNTRFKIALAGGALALSCGAAMFSSGESVAKEEPMIPDFSANAAGLSVRFEAPRKPRSDKTGCGRRRNIDAKFDKKYIDFFTWPGSSPRVGLLNRFRQPVNLTLGTIEPALCCQIVL